MSERKYSPNAKWPRVLDEFVDSGEPLRAIECGTEKQAMNVCYKALRMRCHAELMGVMIVRRGATVYMCNPFASCVKKVVM